MNIEDENDDTHAARCLRLVDEEWSTLPRWRRDARANIAMETDTARIKKVYAATSARKPRKSEKLKAAIYARRQSLAAGHFWRNRYRCWW